MELQVTVKVQARCRRCHWAGVWCESVAAAHRTAQWHEIGTAHRTCVAASSELDYLVQQHNIPAAPIDEDAIRDWLDLRVRRAQRILREHGESVEQPWTSSSAPIREAARAGRS